MIAIDKEKLAYRFMEYVKVDTQSDPNGTAYPTTEKQKDLSRILLQELKAMGLQLAESDAFGYVYATLPSNTSKKNVPAICFCSHVDTAPDCSGTNVKPILHRFYNGKDITLPDDTSQVLSVNNSPYLEKHIGADIITASGLTLLGADDKSGVAVIMQAVETLLDNPGILHGDIKIVFTPDEEVGKGTARIDMAKVGASYGYTLDGGEAGSLEDETFSADGSTIVVHGVISHPGYAKGKLVNAMKIVGEILAALPKNEWSPETTEGMQGFVHPVSLNGIAEKASAGFIVRDFKTAELANHHSRLKSLAEKIVANHPGATMEYIEQEQYRNMKDILVQHPQVAEYAAEAIQRAGLTVKKESIRGGTDGSRLSYMGLPCPNVFTGMQNIHSKTEWIGVNDMAKAVETLVHLAAVWEEKQPANWQVIKVALSKNSYLQQKLTAMLEFLSRYWVVILLVMGVLGSFVTINQGFIGVVTMFGKYQRNLRPGLRMKIPFVEQIYKKISIQNRSVELEFQAVTIDQANVYFKSMLLYAVQNEADDTIKKVAFKFISDKDLMQALVRTIEGNIRAFVATRKQSEILGLRRDIVEFVKEHVDASLEEWGYHLLDLQINDITFDQAIIESMSKVVASNNLKAAAENEGQALLITKTKAAEAEGNAIKIAAEAERQAAQLRGQGVALFREEVARGMSQAASEMKQANLDTNVILFSMWVEAIKNFAEYGKGNVIFLDGGSDGMEKTMKQIMAMTQLQAEKK